MTVRLDDERLRRLQAELRPQAARIVASTAFLVESDAKRLAPVDTGALRNSIQSAEVNDLTWQVRVGVNYGIYVELGTSRMRAQPFLVPAVNGRLQYFVSQLKALFR